MDFFGEGRGKVHGMVIVEIGVIASRTGKLLPKPQDEKNSYLGQVCRTQKPVPTGS